MNNNRTFFEKDELKDRLEKILYSNSLIISNAVVITGPNCKRHIKNLRRSICCNSASTILIPEINEEVYKKQMDWLRSKEAGEHMSIYSDSGIRRTIALKKNVTIVNKCITKVKMERFIDADLMGSVRTQGAIIEQLLDRQVKEIHDTSLRKGIIFTFSSRRTKNEELHSYLKSLVKEKLGSELLFTTKMYISENDLSSEYKWLRHNLVFNHGRLTHMELHTYTSCDGHPMITGLIVYK